MGNKQSEVSKKALEIFRDIEPNILAGQEVRAQYNLGENVVRVQTRLRQVLNEKGWQYRIITAIDSGVLYVRNRKGMDGTPRESELSQMIRKLAMHVDDERLYEEAMALVGTI